MLRKALEEIREGASAGGELLARGSQALEIVSAGTKVGPVSEGQGRPIRFGSPPGRASSADRSRPSLTRRWADPNRGRGEALKPVCDIDAGRSVDGGGFSSDGDNAGSWSVGVPVVVCGMRGVGKSQLAAAYYRECEAGWSLVAWMDASTREQAVAGLGGLAHEMGIDEDGKGDPEGLARRCLSRLNSGDSDRLIVFDNVKDFDDLTGLIPHGRGLRVLVTTTTRPGESLGLILDIGVFTRPQSVDFVVERTGFDDDAGAARLAEALGDPPVALAQAAATIKLNGYATIDEYLAELGEYRLDEIVDSLEKAVVTLLENIDMDEASKNDAQRADVLDMADHLRAISEQQQGQAHYSPHEVRINPSSVSKIINYTVHRLTDMGCPQTALTLQEAVGMLIDALGPDHPDTLATRNNLAAARKKAQ